MQDKNAYKKLQKINRMQKAREYVVYRYYQSGLKHAVRHM